MATKTLEERLEEAENALAEERADRVCELLGITDIAEDVLENLAELIASWRASDRGELEAETGAT